MDPSFSWMQAIKIFHIKAHKIKAAKAPAAPRMFSPSTPVPTGIASDMMATTPAIQLMQCSVLQCEEKYSRTPQEVFPGRAKGLHLHGESFLIMSQHGYNRLSTIFVHTTSGTSNTSNGGILILITFSNDV